MSGSATAREGLDLDVFRKTRRWIGAMRGEEEEKLAPERGVLDTRKINEAA
jgi:hypothetical protein